MIWWSILFILVIAIIVCIKVGYLFFTDYRDPMNGVIAVVIMWIIPCGLALMCAMIIGCDLL